MKERIGILMAGGLGTRLWPWSRRAHPKQFLPLLGQRSLAQMTCDRLRQAIPPENIILLTNSHLVDLAREELPDLHPSNILGEPRSCNTAPCIALASAICEARWGGDAVMAILSSDHYIGDEPRFQESLEAAMRLAESEDCLVTLGIAPTRPEIGYGYLECEQPIRELKPGDSVKLAAFHEKPDQARAMEFLAAGRFLWNMGNFIWRISSIAREFEKSMPDLMAQARKSAAHFQSEPEKALNDYYLSIPDEWRQSIDYGVMVKADNIRAIPCLIAWDDVGSWAVLRRLRGGELDESGNLSLIRHLGFDTRDTVVAGSDTDAGLVVTLGVEKLIIVREGECVLVATEEGLARMRDVAPTIREKGWENLL